MPYISQAERNALMPTAHRLAEDPGQLNFQLACIVNTYLSSHPMKYQRLNDVIGVLECLKMEVNRRIVAVYESAKILENGDVFTCRSKLPKGFI